MDTMVKTFAADCEAWFKDDVEGKATLTLQEAADTAAEAIVVGNEFGPGVPVDTGFARSSFRVALNEAVDGPSQPPGPRRRGAVGAVAGHRRPGAQRPERGQCPCRARRRDG